MKINLFFTLVILFIGQNLSAQEHYEEVIRFNNGRIKSIITYNAQNIKDGETINYHNNGIVQSIIPYINGKINGILKNYHTNGYLESTGLYIDDLQVDNFEYFHRNGKLKSKISYQNGKIYKIFDCYDKRKEPLYCGPFNNGNGEIYIYDEKGKLIAKDHFKNGDFISREKVISTN